MSCPVKFLSEISFKPVSFKIGDWNLTNNRFQENLHNLSMLSYRNVMHVKMGKNLATNPLVVMSTGPPFIFAIAAPLMSHQRSNYFMVHFIVWSRQGTNYLTGPLVVRSRQITNYLTGQSRQGSTYLTGQSRQRSNYLTGLSRQIAFPFI